MGQPGVNLHRPTLAVAMFTRPPRQQLAMQLPGDMPVPIMKPGLAAHSPPAAHPAHCRACFASSSHAGGLYTGLSYAVSWIHLVAVHLM